MEASPDIRSQLDLYLRGELDPGRMSEIKTLIDTDPAWYSTYHALLTESRGIRMTALQDLTSRLQSLEKTIAPQGDLSPSPSSISTTNETEDLENNYTPPAKGLEAEEPASSPHLIQGIRYTTLREELRKLQDVERKDSGETNSKKNDSGGSGGGRVLRMRYWWAVAAGVVVMVVGGYLSHYFKEKSIIKHEDAIAYNWTDEEFSSYLLHETVRSSQPSNEVQKLNTYNLFTIKEFRLAQPKLDKLWRVNHDTLSLYYSALIDFTYKRKAIALYKLQSKALEKYPVNEIIQKCNTLK